MCCAFMTPMRFLILLKIAGYGCLSDLLFLVFVNFSDKN